MQSMKQCMDSLGTGGTELVYKVWCTFLLWVSRPRNNKPLNDFLVPVVSVFSQLHYCPCYFGGSYGNRHIETHNSYYIRQVNGVKLTDILFSLMSVCVHPSNCAHSVFRCKYLENSLR